MPHRSAPLTELGRLRLARCIVDEHWPVARAAERFEVSRSTATRWAQRYRECAALPGSLHQYNHYRPHTAIGNLPPITRCTNVTDQYN